MANPQLSVEITAKIDGLRDAFNKAIRETNNLDKNTKASLSKIDKNFENLANDIDKSMGKASKSVASASNSVSRSLAQAAVSGSKSKNSYLELGRVLQDLPFGFTGIQNNLTQLIPAAGGVGLAFSAIISALTFLQVGTDYWSKSLKGAKTAIDAVNLSGQEYLDTLNQVVQASLGGNISASKEITELKVLYNAYQNANLPLKARQEAYRELQQQYPSYFGNLKFEREASDKTRNAYDTLTQSILATGRARAAVDLISKNESRKLENEQKIIDAEKEKIKLQEKSDKLSQRAIDEQKSNPTREASGLNAAFKAVDAADKVTYQQNIINNLKTDNNKLDEKNLELLKSVNVELAKGAKIVGGFGGSPAKDGIKRNTNILDGLNSNRPTSTGTSLSGLGTGKVQPLALELPKGLSEYVKLAQEAYYSTIRFDEALAGLAETSIGSGIADGFSAIGLALAEGTNAFDAFGTAILSAFTQFLGQLGQMFIKQGIATVLMGKALAINPLTAALGASYISSGIGQIAAGASISVASGLLGGIGKGGKGKTNSKNTAIPGFANGVNNYSGGLALVGERGPELVNLPKGSDVIPSNRSMSMMGANKDVRVYGEFVVSGRNLVAVINDTNELKRRNG